MQQPRRRPDVELLAEVALIQQRAQLALERVLPGGLTAAQFAVLSHLSESGAAQTPGALAEAMAVSGGAMSGTLSKLQAGGLAHIVRDRADARRKWVSLTEQGIGSHRACVAASRAPRDALRQAFSGVEFESALPFLRRLRSFLDQAVLG